MESIFSKIVSGEIPSHKIAENDNYYAFLDINPLAIGHTLVIPKIETDYIFDIEDEQLGGLIVFAKKVGKAVESVINCKRIGVTVIGLEVPHAHIHLIPLNTLYDMDFKQPKLKLTNDELAETAEKIREAFVTIAI
ncbi:MAG: HIT family protein [Bacteroidales bacterium]|jgi:histidine triad (HIT) family protein|nr:HIT family protein [Lentimicrobiaceae bacterium]MBT4764535.1 HIT family protein [bacterium]MDG1135316.1 HIT family protein [Bacteroidales bacterium]MDG1902596.1 HIT family protein [Bacteroidales bacterium]MDG2081805.1 HIT family protein [Bacteroidales bacterium]|tara:strand:- start:17980 stop:18387 length:408 start_codon:yes stop_codon:yes gene_type:complete